MSTFREQIFDFARKQGLILTANRRLARHLQADFDLRMVDSGAQAWKTPQIFSFEGWLSRRANELESAGVPLEPLAEQRLWVQIIDEDTQGTDRALLQVEATAKVAMQAARLLGDYGLSLEGLPLSGDQQAFRRWHRRYRDECTAQGWLDRCGQLSLSLAALREGKLALPQKMLLVGFDQLVPFQHELLDLVRARGGEGRVLNQQPGPPCQPENYACDDAEQEVVLAARWARALLEQGAQSIGIVVPDLQQRRSLIERVFRAHLDPRSSLLGGAEEENFTLSLGAPLLEQGPVLAAFELLTSGSKLRLDQCSSLLRSPYTKAAHAEAEQRSRLENRLRSFRQPQVTRERLKKLAAENDLAPGFAQVLAATELVPKTKHLSPGDWAASFDQLLRQAGWPGDAPLTSSEYQVVMAWREKLLPRLASLDQISRLLPREQALALLRRMAAETEFQVEAPTSPLQVVGLLESSGLEFDQLWVMGMNEEVFPAAARPNPFLPYALQAEHRMPHADAQRELDFARAVYARLSAASPATIYSYAERDGDCELRPSALIKGLPTAAPRFAPAADPAALMQESSAVLDALADSIGPALMSAEMTGGTGILRDQALCPFRAFAHHRLLARATDPPDPGIDPPTRGNLLHRALELFWSEVPSKQALDRLDEDSCSDLVDRVIRSAIKDIYQSRPKPKDELVQLEIERMRRLITEWLEQVEKPRPAFRLLGVEQQQTVRVGSLQIRTVVDRIDELEDGSRVIIDYKTGQVKADLLIGERLLEPQLPIYAVTDLDNPVDGVAFAQLRGGDCRLIGVAREADLLPRVDEIARNKAAANLDIAEWNQLLAHWRQQLDALATAFVAGEAQVDPVSYEQACRYCDLKTLCRISESAGGEL